MDHEVVSLERAAELIGGDKPVSFSTIRRMIAAGVLEARGAGRLRRVTTASIRAYLEGATTWERSDDREAKAAFSKTSTASGGRKSRSETGDTGALVVLIGKTPKPRGRSS